MLQRLLPGTHIADDALGLDTVYYISGGTRDRSEGFGAYLFLSLIERGFAAHPGGALYLGATEPRRTPKTCRCGNLLYRRKLRARASPSAAFTLALVAR